MDTARVVLLLCGLGAVAVGEGMYDVRLGIISGGGLMALGAFNGIRQAGRR